jgi:hypothetical protein
MKQCTHTEARRFLARHMYCWLHNTLCTTLASVLCRNRRRYCQTLTNRRTSAPEPLLTAESFRGPETIGAPKKIPLILLIRNLQCRRSPPPKPLANKLLSSNFLKLPFLSNSFSRCGGSPASSPNNLPLQLSSQKSLLPPDASGTAEFFGDTSGALADNSGRIHVRAQQRWVIHTTDWHVPQESSKTMPGHVEKSGSSGSTLS